MHNINENGSLAYIAITKSYRPCCLFIRDKIYCAASVINPLPYENRLVHKTGQRARVKDQLLYKLGGTVDVFQRKLERVVSTQLVVGVIVLLDIQLALFHSKATNYQ